MFIQTWLYLFRSLCMRGSGIYVCVYTLCFCRCLLLSSFNQQKLFFFFPLFDIDLVYMAHCEPQTAARTFTSQKLDDAGQHKKYRNRAGQREKVEEEIYGEREREREEDGERGKKGRQNTVYIVFCWRLLRKEDAVVRPWLTCVFTADLSRYVCVRVFCSNFMLCAGKFMRVDKLSATQTEKALKRDRKGHSDSLRKSKRGR